MSRHQNYNIFLVGLLCLVAFFSVSLSANEKVDIRSFQMDDWDPKLLSKIEAGSLLLDSSMPIPLPDFSSNQDIWTQMELDVLEYGLKGLRTPEALEKIHAENADISVSDYMVSIGYLPAREDAPNTHTLLDIVLLEVDYFTLREKLRFQRARPHQLRPQVDPVIPMPGHSAYPSGHSAQSETMRIMLSMINPVCAEHYRELTFGIAFRREIAGVHYASDTYAGRLLSQVVISRLLENHADYLEAFVDAAKEEMLIHAGCAFE